MENSENMITPEMVKADSVRIVSDESLADVEKGIRRIAAENLLYIRTVKPQIGRFPGQSRLAPDPLKSVFWLRDWYKGVSHHEGVAPLFCL